MEFWVDLSILSLSLLEYPTQQGFRWFSVIWILRLMTNCSRQQFSEQLGLPIVTIPWHFCKGLVTGKEKANLVTNFMPKSDVLRGQCVWPSWWSYRKTRKPYNRRTNRNSITRNGKSSLVFSLLSALNKRASLECQSPILSSFDPRFLPCGPMGRFQIIPR